MDTAWYETWFDSTYYHILYKNRNDDEAEKFIHKLLRQLSPAQGSKFLDIGCGAGRHCVQVHNQGHEVVGLDLSENSINTAKKYEEAGLTFYVHDMRQKFRINYFDYVLNLFTSFGYFDSEREEIKTLEANAGNLKPNGFIVIDYLNAEKVKQNLVEQEQKTIEGVTFQISRKIENNQVIKTIAFESEKGLQQHQEKVKLLTLVDFERYFDRTGLELTSTFGDYQLNSFNSESDRLILVGKKREGK